MDNSDNKYILKMSGISKRFPGVLALSNINFDLKFGEVHALVGENGAGKSTLIKILSGYIFKDEGEILLNNEKIEIKDTKTALNLGISTIYQENSLIPGMNVAENIFLGKYPIKLGKILWSEVYAKTKKILDSLSINISPKELISNLSVGMQQLIEISKALSSDAKIIVMDEPTSSLTAEETEHLFSIIKNVTKNGISIIYISHRLEEVFRIADRVTVIRDGQLIKTLNVKDTNNKEIVKYMIGKEIGSLFDNILKEDVKDNIILEVKKFTKNKMFKNINFSLKEGEILGFFGLIGAGRTEIIKSILGFFKADEGEILLENKKIIIKSPKDAFEKGFAYVSEDRRRESIIGGMTVKENLTIILLKKFASRLGLLNSNKEKNFSLENIKKFSIKTPSIEQLALKLSGGNQQKMAIAKALSTRPKILVLDEPTRGIDVGSKKEIYDLIKKLSKEGVSVIVVSSELQEIIGLCDRAIVIREGDIVKTFYTEDMTELNILHAALGNL
jgi:ribose transport system ATP-binding protein